MLWIGALSGFSLGFANVALQDYVRRNPTSRLARDMNDDCNRRLCHYVVPMTAMGVGLILWLIAVCTPLQEKQDWWFGSQRQWAVTGVLGFSAGHYAHDIFANQWCGTLLFLHHIAAVAHAVCLQAASSWSGLLLSWSGVYEVGSLVLCMGYIGAVSRPLGHWAATVSTAVGMSFGLHGLIVRWPLSELNAAAWFSIVTLLVLGIGRIQDGVDNIVQFKRKGQEFIVGTGHDIQKKGQAFLSEKAHDAVRSRKAKITSVGGKGSTC